MKNNFEVNTRWTFLLTDNNHIRTSAWIYNEKEYFNILGIAKVLGIAKGVWPTEENSMTFENLYHGNLEQGHIATIERFIPSGHELKIAKVSKIEVFSQEKNKWQPITIYN